MKTVAVLVFFLVSCSSAQDGENEVVFGQIAEPGVESPEGKVLSEDGDVSERQFYRPGSHIRPSYNHGLNAGPIRPGHYNSINYGSAPAAHRPYNRPFNAVRPPNHIYNNGHQSHHHNTGAYRPSGINHNVPPIPFNNLQNNQLSYGSPGVPYINFQSVGPNGRPALTYLTPNFGFFFRNKNAAGAAGAESEIEAVPVAVIDEAADIKFGSRR